MGRTPNSQMRLDDDGRTVFDMPDDEQRDNWHGWVACVLGLMDKPNWPAIDADVRKLGAMWNEDGDAESAYRLFATVETVRSFWTNTLPKGSVANLVDRSAWFTIAGNGIGGRAGDDR